MITISKSSYIRGLQCEKSFYLNFFHKQFGITRDEQDTTKFEIGHDVGRYAQQLFPGGVDCGYEITRDRTRSAELTRRAIKEGKKVIYEAAFEYDGLLCFIDILVKKGNEWIIYEVKSSTSVKDYHYNDAAFQYYVISNNIQVKDAFIVCLNNQYVRNGNIDIKQLFVMESVLETALSLQDEIEINVAKYKKLTEAKAIPDIKLGKQCDDPFACDFKGYCWKDVPEYSVFNIQNMRGKDYELYNMGIVELKDIPKDFKLNDKQLIEVSSYLNNAEYIDKDAIIDFLINIRYPLYFLDFETFQSAIPQFDNSRSYQQIPFQFSLYYKESKDSEAVPYAFLAESSGDPRKAFAESLIVQTQKPGSIVVYNAGFERSRINELARDFPEYAEQLNNINGRIIDLMEPFRQKAYYKPAMRSSYSMKYVLPTINSQYSYENLNVKEGSQASSEFLRLRSIADKQEIEQIRKNLIDYCNQDTFGMIVILEELEKESEVVFSHKEKNSYSIVWREFSENSEYAIRFNIRGKHGYLPFLINSNMFGDKKTLNVEVNERMLLYGILVGLQDSKFIFDSDENKTILLNLLDDLCDGYGVSSTETMILSAGMNLRQEYGFSAHYEVLKSGLLKCPYSSKIRSDLTLVIADIISQQPGRKVELFDEIVKLFKNINLKYLDLKSIEYLIYINFVAVYFTNGSNLSEFLEKYVYKYVSNPLLKNKVKYLVETENPDILYLLSNA
jgi:hypothetical protein